MTGLIRRVTRLLVPGLLLAATAQAIPDRCTNSTWPAFIDLVACDGSGNLPSGYSARVVLRDLANNPIASATIEVAFCDDVRIYNAIPGGTVYGPVFTNAALTDAHGEATLTISGAGFNAGGTGHGTNGSNCATWYVNGIACALANVTTYDEDGATAVARQGVSGSDLAAWVADKVAVPYVYKPRSDFNHNGAIDAPDLLLWVTYKTALPPYVSSCGTLTP